MYGYATQAVVFIFDSWPIAVVPPAVERVAECAGPKGEARVEEWVAIVQAVDAAAICVEACTVVEPKHRARIDIEHEPTSAPYLLRGDLICDGHEFVLIVKRVRLEVGLRLRHGVVRRCVARLITTREARHRSSEDGQPAVALCHVGAHNVAQSTHLLPIGCGGHAMCTSVEH